MGNAIIDLDRDQAQKKLVVQATKRQINGVKTLVPSLSNEGAIKSIAKDIYELSPQQVVKEVPQLLNRIVLGDLSEKAGKTEQISDFENSDEFYKRTETRKGFKIITDEFSDARNTRLYEGFNLIEKKWRQFVIYNFGLDVIKDAPDPENYQSKTHDHRISQYVLSEFFENFLYCPASETYIRKKWKDSDKTEDEVVKLARLKMLDELDFPLNAKDLNFLRLKRNMSMHFRVVTVQEYSQAIDKINHYLRIEAQKEFAQAFATTIGPQITELRNLLLELRRSYDFIWNIRKDLPDLTGLAGFARDLLKK